MSRAEAERQARDLDPGWQLLDDRLVREFRFGSFATAFGLATRIALLAEKHDHHPDLEIGWGRLVVAFTSHDIKGLSMRDIDMARRVDRLVERGLGIREG